MSTSNNRGQAIQSLYKSQVRKIVLDKMIIKPTWKVYLSFEEVIIEHLILFDVVIKNLHGVDHIPSCVCSTIKMMRQNMEKSRRLFMESL